MADDFLSHLLIHRDSAIPIYRQISAAILKAIQNGDLKPNQQLPSENEFAHRFGIVPMTVRQAMNELARAGYIYRVRGRGTYVAPRFLEHTLERMLSFSEDMHARNLIPGSRILQFERAHPSLFICHVLRLNEGETAIHIRRLRLANDQPVGVHNAWIARIEFSQAELEAVGSLYQLLARKEVFLSEGDDLIEAVEADEELSNLLDVRTGAALLRVTRTARDQKGHPIEFVEATYRADLYRYAVHLRR
jgi:GntR family transcriptional regulator